MDPFIVKWLLSFVVGSLWVIVSTYVSEKISGRLGGLIVGLPSTAVVSLLFIGLSQGIDPALTASIVLPLTSGLYSFFFITYLTQTKKDFKNGLFKSILVWFLIALLASILPIESILISVALWLILIILCIWWTVKNIHINTELIPKRIESSPVWVKAAISGSLISVVVLISKLAGPTWGGIFATFPALTMSTFLITVKSGGVEFTRLIAKNIQISITTTLGLYAIFCYIFFPLLGAITGTIVAYIALIVVSIPLYYIVFEKIKE